MCLGELVDVVVLHLTVLYDLDLAANVFSLLDALLKLLLLLFLGLL